VSALQSPQEERIITLIRQLSPSAVQEVEDFVAFLAARSETWSYADPTATARAAAFMARDPFLRREAEAINAEFSSSESDGLGDY